MGRSLVKYPMKSSLIYGYPSSRYWGQTDLTRNIPSLLQSPGLSKLPQCSLSPPGLGLKLSLHNLRITSFDSQPNLQFRSYPLLYFISGEYSEMGKAGDK